MLFISPQKLFSFSRYLSFCLDFLILYLNVLIRKIKLISKFMTSQPSKQTVIIHVLPSILRNKDNQAMKFGQLKEYNMKNIFFLKNHTHNVVEKLVPDLFLKSLNWVYLWINSLNFYSVCFIASPSGWLPKCIRTKLLNTCFYFL